MPIDLDFSVGLDQLPYFFEQFLSGECLLMVGNAGEIDVVGNEGAEPNLVLRHVKASVY